MSIGNSGRIVIELDPVLKKQLYSALTRDGSTLKDWFVEQATSYLTSSIQMSLPIHEPSPTANDAQGPNDG